MEKVKKGKRTEVKIEEKLTVHKIRNGLSPLLFFLSSVFYLHPPTGRS